MAGWLVAAGAPTMDGIFGPFVPPPHVLSITPRAPVHSLILDSTNSPLEISIEAGSRNEENKSKKRLQYRGNLLCLKAERSSLWEMNDRFLPPGRRGVYLLTTLVYIVPLKGRCFPFSPFLHASSVGFPPTVNSFAFFFSGILLSSLRTFIYI